MQDDAQYPVYPKKWRDTCDPFQLKFQRFVLKSVIGYPHAGNDVFHVIGSVCGREVRAYLKVARREGGIKNEVGLLRQLDQPVYPKVLDCDEENGSFSVTEEMQGVRLSELVGDNGKGESLAYLEEYGAALAKFHTYRLVAGRQTDRKWFHRPSQETLNSLGLGHLDRFFQNPLSRGTTVFCHGDFHYANLLWEDGHISAILDLELAGYGDRDFDIAWALVRRPGQRFMNTEEEAQKFLVGYQKYGVCDVHAVTYYMAQCYVHYLAYCNDLEYCSYAVEWLSAHCNSK